MSKLSEDARDAAKSKAARLVRNDPHARVDASGYKPDGAMDADAVTGMRPVSRRQYRRGGKVAGEASPQRADRKPRANGGRALTADSLINRDVKEANKERGGLTHDGGMKRGGRAHKDMGGLALPAWADAVSRATGGRAGKMGGGALSPLQRMALQRHTAVPPAAGAGMPLRRPIMRADGGGVHGSGCGCAKCGGGSVTRKARGGAAINDGTRPVAGRLARKGGGRTKKGTNVNIIITQPSPKPAMPMPPPGAAPAGGLHQAAPPVMPPTAGMAPPPGAPGVPSAVPLMPRAYGGRASNPGFSGKFAKPGKYPIESGSGGGLGRLEKAARAARG